MGLLNTTALDAVSNAVVVADRKFWCSG